jgi:Na+-transporting NADH:ubiquinone oxidoreductase subunit C
VNKSSYIIGFVSAMTGIVALVLSLLYSGLKDIHKQNEVLFEQRAMLISIEDNLGLDIGKLNDKEVAEIFKNSVRQKVINVTGEIIDTEEVIKAGYSQGSAQEISLKAEFSKSPDRRLLPMYVYEDKSGNEFFIMKMFGKGLWDEISAYVSVKNDMNTINGVSFDHKAETPGLGAEIKDDPRFAEQYKGKRLFDDSGNLVSVTVKKGKATDQYHEVDGISGATITLNGVTDMFSRSLANYEEFLKKNKSNN